MTGLRMGIATALCACAAACAGSSTHALHGGRTVTPRLAPARTPAIAGGTAAQRALLDRIVRAQRPTQIVRLTISRAHGGVALMAATPRTPKRGPDTALGGWEAWIVGAAFRDRSAALGLPRVVVIGDPSESGRATGGPDRPRRPPAGLGAFRRRVVALAAPPGAQVVTVRVADPDGYTAIVALRVSDPAGFLRHRWRELDVRLGGLHADGVFVVLYEPDGRVLWSEGGSARLLSGLGGAADPRYRGCIPDQMTGLGMSPPPCPAT
jgi:hypothetical protein